MLERCPRCRLAFERGNGFWLGAMAINLGVTEAAFGVFIAAGLLLTWPEVPWVPLTVLGVLVNVAVPILFYPLSKTIFLAIDLLLHQVDNRDARELEATEPMVTPPPPPASPSRPRSAAP